MADTQSNIQVNIDTTQALASIKNLQRQISAFHSSIAKGGAAANAVSAQMQQTLINSINATGQFSAQIKTIRTTTESFTSALEKNKFSLGEYFRYAGGASKTFGRLFKTEHDTINKVARENVKDLQTQYIRMGRDASGAMKAIAVRPLSLDMTDLATRTQIAAQKQAILNQLLKQGSTNLLNFGKNTQWAGRQLMVGFTLPLIAVGSAASKTFMDMEAQAIRFKKVYGDLFTPNAESQQALKDIQELGKEFTKYGIAVSTTVGLAAEAAAAGFKGVDLQRQTAAATRLSILGQVESQKALETTIALQNAFSMSSENLAESIDFLNAVENQTVLSLDDVSTAIPKAAPVIQQLGGDVKDLAFFMTAMKEGGINASEGANALKSGLASMINPTGKAAAMLESFGINVKKIVLDNKGDLKKTVVEFATALNMLDPLNRAQAIEQMFGKFQFARLSTLFANVTKEGTQASRVLDLAGASVQDLASLSEKELGMTSESAMNKFKGAVENLKLSLIPLGEQFLKAVTPIAEFITRVLDKFNNFSDTTKKIIVVITGIVAGLGPVLLMTAGLVMNGLANMIKLFAFLKSAFNKTGQSTATLGTEVKYMTTEQRNAAAVAASLDQVHVKLSQTFTSEATAVNALTRAYQRAIAAQSQFVPVAPPITRGPIKKFAEGKPVTVGGTGNKDSELALLMPGETVIPTAMSQKYGGLINAMIADKVPGYKRGVPKTGTAVDIPGGFAAAHFGGSSYKTGRELLAMVTGLDTAFAVSVRNMVASVEGGLDRVFTVFNNEIIATSTELNRAVGQTGSGKTAPIALAKRDLIGTGAATRDIELQRQLEAAGVPIEEIRVINKKITERIKVGFKKLGKKATVTAEELDKLVDDAYSEVAKTDDRVRAARTRMKKTTAVTDPRTDSRIAVSSDPYTKFRKSGAYYAGMERAVGTDSVPYEKNARFKITNDMAAQIGLSSKDAALVYNQFSNEVKVRLAGLRGDITKFSVEFAKEAEKAGIKTGNAYKVGLDKVVTADPYVRSRDRGSPHRLAAQDGRDDATAYVAARDETLTQAGRKPSGRAPGAATRAQGPAPIGATPQQGATILPIVSQPTEKDLRKTRNRNRAIAAKGKIKESLSGGRGMAISSGLMIGSQFLPGKTGEIAGKASGVAFGLQALAMLPGPLKIFAAAIAAGAGVAKLAAYTTEQQRLKIEGLGDAAAASKEQLQTLGSFFGVTVREIGREARTPGTTLGAIGATQRSAVNSLRGNEDFLSQFKNDINALKSASVEDATMIFNALAIQLKGRGFAQEQIKTIIQALQEEAGKTNLNLDFKTIGITTEESLSQQAKIIGARLQKVVDEAIPQLKIAPGSFGGGFGYYEQGTDEQLAQINAATSSMSAIIEGLIGQFEAGEISLAEFNSQFNALSQAILSMPEPTKATLLAKMFDNISPTAAKAVEGIKSYNAQLKILLAISFGIISEEDRLIKLLTTATDPKVIGRIMGKLNQKMGNFFKLFEANTIADAVVDTEDYQEATDGLSTASEAYLKILGKEIDALEAKRNAQKDANDETQRQLDLQMKLSDLANQAVLAKISGDYIKAATIEQQAQNVQLEFDQETELRKKDAEIAKLKARYDAIKGGAKLTKAESAKIPKVRAASGGAIRGAGTGTSDSIPAYLSNGEYVIKAKSVKKYGTETFDALNAGRFAEGGLIQDPNKVYLPDGSEARKMSREERDRNYRISRDRFLAQRQKYKDFVMPQETPKELANRLKAMGYAEGGLIKGYDKGGLATSPYGPYVPTFPVLRPYGPYVPVSTSPRLNIPLSAGATATMTTPATGIAGDPRFRVEKAETKPFEPIKNAISAPFKLAWKALNPSAAPDISKQSDYSQRLREAYEKTLNIMHNVYAPSRVGTFFMKPTMDAMVNITAGDGKWNDYTTIGSNFLGYGLIKTGVKGIASGLKNMFSGTKSAATKIKVPKTPSRVIPKPNISALAPEEKAFAMADIDAQALLGMKSANPSTLSVADEGFSFDPGRANAGLRAIKTGDPEKIRLATDHIWELVQSQREALLRSKYPKADLSNVKTFNELYAKEFYGLSKDDIIKIFKGGYGASTGASWRTGADDLGTYFSTNPYVAAEYARFKDRVPFGKELPMFSMDVPISKLPTPLGQGASGMQGSLEFPQVIPGPMLAAQTPQAYDLPAQVYGLMSNPANIGQVRYWPYDDGLFGGGAQAAASAAQAASKPQGLLKKLFNLPASRRAETLLKNKQMEERLAEEARKTAEALEFLKNNPRPVRPGAPGAPAAAPKSAWDEALEELFTPSSPEASATVAPKSGIKDIVKNIGKVIAKPITTPANFVKQIGQRISSAWRLGRNEKIRWEGNFDSAGRERLLAESINRVVGSFASRFNPKLTLQNKLKAQGPNGIESDAYSVLQRYMSEPGKRPNPYALSYKNIPKNILEKFVKSPARKVGDFATRSKNVISTAIDDIRFGRGMGSKNPFIRNMAAARYQFGQSNYRVAGDYAIQSIIDSLPGGFGGLAQILRGVHRTPTPYVTAPKSPIERVLEARAGISQFPTNAFGPGNYFATSKVTSDKHFAGIGKFVYKTKLTPSAVLKILRSKGFATSDEVAKIAEKNGMSGTTLESIEYDADHPLIKALIDEGYLGYRHGDAFTNWMMGVMPGMGFKLIGKPVNTNAPKSVIKKANGGLIKGPGTGTSDSIRASLGYAGGGSIRVSNGEYVVKASSVRDYGVKAMDAINNGTARVGTESGGTVYNINMPVTSNNANPEIVANEVMRKLKLEISKNNKTNKVGG
jgi:TP901 family phage tail tape measure protein